MEQLTHDLFEPHIDSSFLARLGTVRFELVLKTVDLLNQGHDAQQPFSLLFEGSASTRFDQQLVTLSHGELGEMTIFLIPIGEHDGKITYEAIFN